MRIPIRGTITVTGKRIDAKVLGDYLSGRSGNYLNSIADEVAEEAQKVLKMQTTTPSVKQKRVNGRYWSLAPSAVAKQVKRKDGSELFSLKAERVKEIGVTRVSLAVADHPYSKAYQFGGSGFPATRFLTTACRRVAARRSRVRFKAK